MDFASPLLELVKQLWGLASKPLGYICNLKENVRSLEVAKKDLKAVSEDLKTRVEREEGGGAAQRTKRVENWLGKVQEFEDGIDQVLPKAEERDRIKSLSRCLPWNCRSSYRLGKRVDQMLKEAGVLQTEGENLGAPTSPLPPPPVLELPGGETVGLDISLNKVLQWLVDEKLVGPIGLYGTGGVGKTTLLKRINEELSHANHGFDVVIWVVVSKQVNEDSIRDVIRKRLDIQDENWDRWTRDERVHHLYDALTRKKFVLLIDDVWRRLDLSNIGVPHPNLRKNGSKIVFTTRSKQVCDQMAADKTFEVQCLPPEGAWELFENSVGKSTVHSHPEILELAKGIAGECKGLPLALITIGRAMAGRTNPHAWKHALKTLGNNPHKLSDMVEEVYCILELSYSNLNDPTLQRCFLYCCLFPEDYLIRPHNLIELWTGEGLLEDTNDVYRMRDHGEYVLDSLKMACLLESGLDVNGRPYVKMHDVIRDMATWIARDHGQKENKLLAIEKEEDMSMEMISKWEEAKKVSIWGKWIRNINQTPPQCSQLETLFIRETNVSSMPRGFFNSMKAYLTLLDLSDSSEIELFPDGICDLINLKYLNLSGTSIRELPKEIKNLTRLRWLLLDYMRWEILIPIGAITSLPLNIFSCWYSRLVNEEEIVEELERMQHLTDLSIVVRKSSSTMKIFESPNIRKRIRRACIIDSDDDLTNVLISYSPAGGDSFSHLEVLYLMWCNVLREVEITRGIGRAPISPCFPNLVEVSIFRCGLPNLSWLVHAPKLRKLRVGWCSSMEKIIGDGFTREELATSGLFSRLEHLILECLPKLTSICDHALPFPNGVRFEIYECPGLRKLPLDSNDARGTFKFTVEGEQFWLAELEWDPADLVTFHAEEMAFGEAARKMKDGSHRRATIGFGPRGSGPTE